MKFKFLLYKKEIFSDTTVATKKNNKKVQLTKHSRDLLKSAIASGYSFAFILVFPRSVCKYETGLLLTATSNMLMA